MARDPSDRDRWLDAEPLIDMVADLRLDMIDFQLNGGLRSRDPDDLLRIKTKCHDRGLPIGFLGIGSGLVGTAENSAGERIGVSLTADERHRRIDELKEAVDAAVVIGAPLIRLFGGGVPAASADREQVWTDMISCFQEICDYAASRAILIGLHNHAPAVAPTGDDILRILNDVDRPNFTHILDTGQWWGSIGSGYHDPDVDIYRYMEQTAPHASYVRAKIYKIDSGVEEWLDYERIIDILRAVDYNGHMSMVYEDRGNNCDLAEAIRLATAHLRQLLAR